MLDKHGILLSAQFHDIDRAGTFRENKATPIHGWFSYTEGYSFRLIQSIIKGCGTNPKLILDPFGGSSTSGVEAIFFGANYHGYDINPAMKIVADAKTSSAVQIARAIRTGKLKPTKFQFIVDKICEMKSRPLILNNVFCDKPYFSHRNFRDIDNIRQNIDVYIDDPNLYNLFLGALLSTLVNVSHMKRSPDLKYREKKDWNRPSATAEFRKKCLQILSDLFILPLDGTIGRARNIVGSAKSLNQTDSNSVDIVITSPPYLNGTNYIRNTKLELWVARLLSNDNDLKGFRIQEISSGINSAQKLECPESPWKTINHTIERIKNKAYDPRITPMVANYFNDMSESLSEIYRVLRKRRKFYMVVGDSAFSNVHIPTDTHLGLIARSKGFSFKGSQLLRKRRSRGGMSLREVLMVFEK